MVCATSFPIALAFLLLSACSTAIPSVPTAQTVPASAPVDLIGSWDVSLYYSPDAAPSSTRMVITSVTDGELIGSFYDSAFSDVSRVTSRGGIAAFTAVTADGTGDYIHSGRLEQGVIEGQTLSEGRAFLMTWTAIPVSDQTQD